MGLIGNVLNAPGALAALGDAAKGVAEVFVPTATKRMELSAQAQKAALEQFGDEFSNASTSGFDRLVNGLNRLPRPLLAFGTIGLFVYAMIDPKDFALRMVGLNAVPEPLWWLLGAVVAFYFGARETHYFRNRPVSVPTGLTTASTPPDANSALDDWRTEQN
ncbi:MAG: holin family protein [Cypionkella sp.]|uniref:holin family protein n=1 Tax=Cypionkella sp. TaxID=2811411 RepID=UPI002ABA8A0A|nr:holin family protein [Cypionkella sp.]MDZ4312697.1 holin family protein [Cypionkella sp.]